MSMQRTNTSRMRHLGTRVACAMLAVVAGCGEEIRNRKPEAAPVLPTPKVEKPAAPMITSQAALEPVIQHDPTEPLDLMPAVEETRQVFRDYHLPVDWYSSLKLGDLPSIDESTLFATAIWEMVKPEVSQRFQRRFHTLRAPTSELHFGAIGSDNTAFEEMMLLTLIGPDHKHLRHREVQVQQFYDLPNLDAKLLKPDGAVDFVSIREAFSTQFPQGALPLPVNAEASQADNDSEFCRVVSAWQSFSGDRPDWVLEQVAWRFVAHIEFVDGIRTMVGTHISGPRRLAMDSYIQVGFRADRSLSFKPVFLAGPYIETAYQPVGKAQVGVSKSTEQWASMECKKLNVYGDLTSLNVEISPTEKMDIDREVENRIPIEERPSLTSVRSRPDVTQRHIELHYILAPRQKSVPALN